MSFQAFHESGAIPVAPILPNHDEADLLCAAHQAIASIIAKGIVDNFRELHNKTLRTELLLQPFPFLDPDMLANEVQRMWANERGISEILAPSVTAIDPLPHQRISVNGTSPEATIRACSGCGENIRADYIVLDPCTHDMCTKCFAKGIAMKKGDCFFLCPHQDCSASIKGHHFYEINELNNGHTVQPTYTEHADPTIDLRRNPDMSKDPYRAFSKECRSLTKEDKIGRGVLFFAAATGTDQVVRYNATFTKRGFASSENLVKIFACLYEVISALLPEKNKSVESLNPSELIEFAISDERLLTKLVLALATGKILTPENRSQIRNQGCSEDRSQLFGCFTAAEMMQRVDQSVPCRLQLALGDLINIMTWENSNLIKFLSEMRITSSYSTIVQAMKRDIQESSKKKLETSPFAFNIFVSDNFSATKKGLEATKDQWTILSMHSVGVDALKEAGFYPDDPSEQISRESKSIETFVAEEEESGRNPAETMVVMNEFDSKINTIYNLRPIELVSSIDLPGFEECLERKRRKAFVKNETIPRNLGIDVSERPRTRIPIGERTPRLPQRHEPGQPGQAQAAAPPQPGLNDFSFLDSMNITIDYPMNKDQASKDAVVCTMDYITEICERSISRDLENLPEGHERPVQEIMIPFCGDGSPMHTALRLLDSDKQKAPNNQRYALVRPHAGGFHFNFETIIKTGELMYSFKQWIVSQFRPSKGRQEHYLSPSNTNQFEEEVISVLAAIARAAHDSYKEAFPEESDTSAAKVHRHMLERAKSYPIAMGMLEEYRLTIVYFILRDAEKSGDLDLFFTGVRMAMPIFTTTNAYKYVRIGGFLLEWYQTASPAEKVLTEHFIFTRKTVDGKRACIDRTQEWVNLLFRKGVGDLVRPGFEQKMIHYALHLNSITEKSKAKHTMKNTVTKPRVPFNDSMVKVGKVYVTVYIALRKMNVWGTGAIKIGDGFRGFASDEVLQTPLGDRWSAQILNAWSIGVARAVRYMDMFHIRSSNSIERRQAGEDGVSLSRIISTPTAYNNKISCQRILQTSTQEERIKKAAGNKKAPLITELLRLKQVYPGADEAEECVDEAKLRKRKVDGLVRLLVDYRKAYYSFDPTARDSTLAAIHTLSSDGTESTQHERDQELALPIYQLHEDVVAMFE